MKPSAGNIISIKYHLKLQNLTILLTKWKFCLPKSSLKTLVTSLIQSHINYGLIIWGCSQHRGQVALSLKKSLRIINKRGFNHHKEPLHKQNEILKVDDLYRYNGLTFMYQLKNGQLPIPSATWIIFLH